MSNMDTFAWKKGEFYAFRATRKIQMPANIDLEYLNEDEVFEFDGSTLKTETGHSYSAPALKGGLDRGWFVSSEDQTSTYVPQPAGVEMHTATHIGNDPRQTVSHIALSSADMDYVGQISDSTKRRKDAAFQKAVPKQPQVKLSADAKDFLRQIDLEAAKLGFSNRAPAPPPAPAAPAQSSSYVGRTANTNTIVEQTPEVPFRSKMRVESREQEPVKVTSFNKKVSIEEQGVSNVQAFVAGSDRTFSGVDQLNSPVTVGSGGEMTVPTTVGSGKPPRRVTSAKTASGEAATKSSMTTSSQDEGVPFRKLGSTRFKTEIKDFNQASSEIRRLDGTAPSGSPARSDHSDFPWQRGQFRTFRSLKEVRLPSGDDINDLKKLEENEIFQFDGETLKLGSDEEIKAPSLKGGLKAGLFVLDEGEAPSASLQELAESLKQAEPAQAPAQEKDASVESNVLDAVRAFLPDFNWDLSMHWKKRVKTAVEQYGDKPEWIKAILAIEQPAVKRHIQSKLAK